METTEKVTGEKYVTSEGTALSKPGFEPVPTGDYELRLMGDKVTVKAPSEGNEESVPYIAVTWEVLNSAKTEGGKNRKVFQNFFLKTAPSEKGSIAWKSTNGLNGLAKAVGDDFKVSAIEYTTRSGKTFEILNPDMIKMWLQAKDGMVVNAHLKAVKGGTYLDKNGVTRDRRDGNEVSYFITQ